ncbi:acyl-CoA synthetase (AMP-forming)/AMP-acid ligase II [Nocardiopsis mwathae]|uniref:Acyl-CoA synthetase (AMP-forming)/AMP-acid ligase II n=1 Tax=Nocardiopsis mwathae TaxID=1472723 RepID=A0A7W9YGS2_9ACTN|nr:fatty acyl-AMP ligase [Nocardiopsis mwathae]MBB6171865.1 acyl-CoA synthetase (AMP-forming)/AMP-acid ligase II [Nocardiopsis mwathae]
MPASTTLYDLCRDRAETRPDSTAFTFLHGGEAAADLTYRGLDDAARGIAAGLAPLARPGDRALLLYEPGLDFLAAFYGCLYAGLIPAPVPPPNARKATQALARLMAIAASAEATLLLSTGGLLARLAAALGTDGATGPAALGITPVATDLLTADPADWRPPRPTPDDPAYLQFSSGSTGQPKGTVITHSAALHNLDQISRTCGLGPEHGLVSWLPMHHDTGLVAGALVPLHDGFPVWLMSPLEFLQRPAAWLSAISRLPVTGTVAPDFGYELCVRRVNERQRADLDLSGLRLALSGAEPVRPATIEAFTQAFEPCGFRSTAFLPCYGLAEATLLVSGGPAETGVRTLGCDAEALAHNDVVPAAGAPGARTLVACGQVVHGVEAVIVDPESTTPCPPGRVGEIWLDGPNVGSGYYNDPERTAETFGAVLAGTPGRTYLRTGDLGFLHEGLLYITGRIKDVLIVDGRNLYSQDLELTIRESHPALDAHKCAVFPVDDGTREEIVAVVEADPDDGPDEDRLAKTVREAVGAEHGVQLDRVLAVRPGSIPLTASGKVQRFACRDAVLDGTLDAARITPPAPAPEEV